MAIWRIDCLEYVLDFVMMLPSNTVTVVVMTGLIGIFIPFSRTMDMIYAGGGCLIFSGYVVFDTYMITKRLSPDEYIMAAISLYLE